MPRSIYTNALSHDELPCFKSKKEVKVQEAYTSFVYHYNDNNLELVEKELVEVLKHCNNYLICKHNKDDQTVVMSYFQVRKKSSNSCAL